MQFNMECTVASVTNVKVCMKSKCIRNGLLLAAMTCRLRVPGMCHWHRDSYPYGSTAPHHPLGHRSERTYHLQAHTLLLMQVPQHPINDTAGAVQAQIHAYIGAFVVPADSDQGSVVADWRAYSWELQVCFFAMWHPLLSSLS